MVKSISAQMRSHLNQETTSLCTCWRITRKDGVELFFTDHDADVLYGGHRYKSSFGYDRTAMSSDSSMSVDNLEIVGIIDDEEITREDLRAGLYDFADVRVFLVNWADVSSGDIKMKRGILGEVSISDNDMFKVEFRSMTQLLDQRIGEVFQPECRAELGDSRCKVNLLSYTTTATVTVGGSRTNFAVNVFDGRATAGWYSGGVASFLTGANAGFKSEIRYSNDSLGVELFYGAPNNIEVGSIVTLSAGCDKRIETCSAKFANVLNFRGEPFIPGQDAYFSYPNAS